MITLILVELDKERKNILLYKEKEFEKVHLGEINKWIDDKFKFGILTNSDYSSINRYGGTIIRNGAIIIKNRKLHSKIFDNFFDYILTEVEQKLIIFKIENILN